MKPYLLLLGASVALAACDSRPTVTQTPPTPPPARELSVAEQDAIANKVAERLERVREEDARTAAEREAEIREQVRREVEDELARREALNPPPQTTVPAPVEPEPPAAQPAPGNAARTSAWNPQGVGGYDMFYEALAPQGVWYETANFGYVWQPTIAARNPSWRPYVDGQWADSDQGWIWISQEPFGWATYHYGRWASLENIGWVWVPGNEWAPAWVSWRETDDYIGWAPLPPLSNTEVLIGEWADDTYGIGPECYNFIPVVQFHVPTYRTVVINHFENVRIIEHTRNVTNIHVRNNNVCVGGPRYDKIKDKCPGLIKTRPIARVDSREKLDVRENGRGDTLVVYSPKIERKDGRPAEVSRKLDQPRVRTGWEGVHDPAVKTRLQQQLGGKSGQKRENTVVVQTKDNEQTEPNRGNDNNKARPERREETRVSYDAPKQDHAGGNGGNTTVTYPQRNQNGGGQQRDRDERRNDNSREQAQADQARQEREENSRRQQQENQRREQEERQRRDNEENQRRQQQEQQQRRQQQEENQRRQQEDNQRRQQEQRQREQEKSRLTAQADRKQSEKQNNSDNDEDKKKRK